MNGDDEETTIIRVHPLLLEEFKVVKEEIEKKVGYKIYKGMPIVSKMIAMSLQEKRKTGKGVIEVTFDKIKGEKKIKIDI